MLTKAERLMPYLACFDDQTYAMSIPTDLARFGEKKGWLEWVPPVLGTQWAIIEAGRAALQEAGDE